MNVLLSGLVLGLFSLFLWKQSISSPKNLNVYLSMKTSALIPEELTLAFPIELQKTRSPKKRQKKSFFSQKSFQKPVTVQSVLPRYVMRQPRK